MKWNDPLTPSGLVAALAAMVAILYVWPSSDQALGHCRLQALKSFGHMRKRNDAGFYPLQTELEDRYVEECMHLRGFQFDTTIREKEWGHVPALHQVGSEDRNIWMMDPAHWTRVSYWPSLP